jgi:ribosome-associated toxin RatA of RatAB toxin-antitoxin module
MPAQVRTVEIDAAPSRVMAVITDFRSYPDFLSEMRRVRMVREGEGVWEVQFTVYVIRELTYTLRLVRHGDERLEWTLVEGMFKANEGSWTLEPLADGARTRATYTIDLQVGMFVPGNIVRSLTDRSLPDTLSRFKAEAERRAAVALAGDPAEA